jgi:hypothetical protein
MICDVVFCGEFAVVKTARYSHRKELSLRFNIIKGCSEPHEESYLYFY